MTTPTQSYAAGNYRAAPKVNPIGVEYTARGERVVKNFPDPYSARRFYAAKLKAGADPKVVKVN